MAQKKSGSDADGRTDDERTLIPTEQTDDPERLLTEITEWDRPNTLDHNVSEPVAETLMREFGDRILYDYERADVRHILFDIDSTDREVILETTRPDGETFYTMPSKGEALFEYLWNFAQTRARGEQFATKVLHDDVREATREMLPPEWETAAAKALDKAESHR